MSLSELKVIDFGRSESDSMCTRSLSVSSSSSSMATPTKTSVSSASHGKKVTQPSHTSLLPPKVPVKNGTNTKLSQRKPIQRISCTPLRSLTPTLSLSRTSLSSDCSSNSTTTNSALLTPRRIFSPAKPIDLVELELLDHAKTVFDGKLSFDLGCNKQRVRQECRASPAHTSETETASRYLSEKIRDFLKRTDHVMDDWLQQCKEANQCDGGGSGGGRSSRSNSQRRRHCDMMSMIEEQRKAQNDPLEPLARSKSVANIMIKSYQMSKNMPPTERSNSMSRILSDQHPQNGGGGSGGGGNQGKADDANNDNDDDDTISIVSDQVLISIVVTVCCFVIHVLPQTLFSLVSSRRESFTA